jgi:diacylglycerol kinase (ATP)
MQHFSNNKTILLLNPNSGTGKVSILEKNLHKYKNVFDYITLTEIDDFPLFIKSRIPDYDVFIAVGGDGTVNSLACYLMNTDKILGVLPYGSGNGFAREMGFKKNLHSLLKNIDKKSSFDVDVLKINNQPFINVAGVGLDSFVAHSFHTLNKRGFWNYGITTLKTVKRLKPFEVNISVNNHQIKEKLFMASVANTRQFGNDAFMAPQAKADDGKFNIVLLRPFPKYQVPVLIVRLMSGTLDKSHFVKYFESDQPVVISTDETRFHIDGEPCNISGEVKIEICKNALRVLKTKDNNRNLNPR